MSNLKFYFRNNYCKNWQSCHVNNWWSPEIVICVVMDLKLTIRQRQVLKILLMNSGIKFMTLVLDVMLKAQFVHLQVMWIDAYTLDRYLLFTSGMDYQIDFYLGCQA